MEQNQQSPVFDQQPDQQPSAPQYEPYVPMMSFGQAVKTCFKKYFDFKGRARRSEYWWFNLFNFIVTFIWSLIASFISIAIVFRPLNTATDINEYNPLMYIIIMLLITIIPLIFLYITQYAVMTRRLHDTGRSGWWIVLSFATGIGYLVTYFMAIMPILSRIGDDENYVPTTQFQVVAETFQSSPALAVFMCIFALAALIVSLAILVFTIQDSDRGENKYGPSPKYN